MVLPGEVAGWRVQHVAWSALFWESVNQPSSASYVLLETRVYGLSDCCSSG